MKLASFNLENLFSRAKAMNRDTWQDGKGVLSNYAQLNILLAQPVYTAADKQAILELLSDLGLSKKDDSKFVTLRQNRGHLLKRPKTGPAQVIANGRGDWIGWLELNTEAVDVKATQMTAKVIKDVSADVLAVIEAEDRVALKYFNDQLLKPANAAYEHIMLIDGNDDRGIDVGLMCKGGYPIGSIFSHVDDAKNGKTIFCRDCAEYTVDVGHGQQVLILVNHFKSKGFGSPVKSNERRKSEAMRVKEIYDARKAQGINHIAIVGDFNDTPESDPISPLLNHGSDLKDITDHAAFQSDGRPGTFGTGAASNKIDYILLSPALFSKVEAGGIFRKGVWGGANGTIFPHYPEMTQASHAASDHAAIWAEINV